MPSGRITGILVLVGVLGCSSGDSTPATWPCGTQTCSRGQVCASSYMEGPPGPMTFVCNPLPAACAADPTCECLEAAACGGNPAPGSTTCGCDATGCNVACVEP